MKSTDKYLSFSKLSQHEREGKDFTRIAIPRDTGIAILAPHGGGIEPGTSEIAAALARDDLSFYAFEGLKPSGSQALHITSTNIDEPSCVSLVGQSHTVVSIHGCQGEHELVYVGGLDGALRARLIQAFICAGIAAVEDNSHHSGKHPSNICNRGRSRKGAQLELTAGLRRKMFKGLKAAYRRHKTPLFALFVYAVRQAVLDTLR